MFNDPNNLVDNVIQEARNLEAPLLMELLKQAVNTKIGAISDDDEVEYHLFLDSICFTAHDDPARAEHTVRLLNARGAKLLLHAANYMTPQSRFVAAKVKIAFSL